MVATKRCNVCKEAKPASEFNRMRNSPDGLQYKCKPCMRQYKIKWERENAERLRIQRRHGDIRRYGIEPEDYDRMLAEQGGVCAICLKPESSPRRQSLHIDHCHDTGRVRGLLCRACNQALGLLRDNTEAMARAIEYLNAGCEPPTPLRLAPVS